VGFDQPDYVLGRGQLDYAAEARLINDNLLDFSHLTYVHANSFASGSDFAERQPKITMLERGVRFERWVCGGIGNAAIRASDEPVDRWQSYDFLVPGVLLMWSAGYPLGTAEALDYKPPRPEDATTGLNFTSQAVTPMSEKTARYFFSWGPHRRHGDERMRDNMMKVAAQAFGEDKVMIEAQQCVVDATASPQIMPTAHDRGVTLFNGLVRKLVQAESDTARNAA
jgi:vanillate O-demethylase monooxygenase subunit